MPGGPHIRVALLLVVAACAASASAQPRPPGGPEFGGFPGAELLRPLPEDEGPLQPGEADELFEFARRNVPFVHRALRRMEDLAPDEFEHRLQRAAPRLRQLKRIFDRNPQLGERIVRFAENQQRIRFAKRNWDEGERSPALRQRLTQEIRPLFAENLRIEQDVLRERLDDLTARREVQIDREVERLTADGFDPADVPADVRELLRKYRDAATESELDAARRELRRVGENRIDSEISMLRERVNRVRNDAAREVDRRVGRFFDAPPPDRPPPRDRPPNDAPRRPRRP
jgi:hypothetical protein